MFDSISLQSARNITEMKKHFIFHDERKSIPKLKLIKNTKTNKYTCKLTTLQLCCLIFWDISFHYFIYKFIKITRNNCKKETKKQAFHGSSHPLISGGDLKISDQNNWRGGGLSKKLNLGGLKILEGGVWAYLVRGIKTSFSKTPLF